MRVIVMAVILLLNLILQSTLFQYIAIMGIKPNTMIIIIVAVAFMRGELEGLMTGFAVGLLQDSFFAPFIGLHTILGTTIGYLCGKFFSGFYKESSVIPLLLTIISVFVYEFAYYVLSILMHGYTDFVYFMNRIILPEVVYTALFAFFLYKLLYFINVRLEEREKYRRKLF